MFDLLFKNALIIDGSGKKGCLGDVAVEKGRITALDRDIDGPAARVIEAGGLVLAPGFIDLHTHTDTYHITDPTGGIKVRQGVCLDVAGNCGESAAPTRPGTTGQLVVAASAARRTMRDYAAAVDEARPSIRVMSHVGHSNLRILAMGYTAGPPTTEQLGIMKYELAAALEQGAAGFSTGLYYPPSGFARAEELIELAKVTAGFNRFHASHIRNEAEGLIDSIKEIIQIGLAANIACHISHLKAAGRKNWGRVDEVAALFDSARARGLDLTCDVYPYHHSATGILALIPPWAQEGGVAGLVGRLESPRQRDLILGQMKEGLPGWENIYLNAGFEGITISAVNSKSNKNLEGVTIARAANQAEADPFEFVLGLIAAEAGAVKIIAASMNEENVARFIALPFALIGSDGSPNPGRPHPRLYGTFPRVIRRFVRELGVLSLEEAVAKMTGLAAQRLGLQDTGLIEKNKRADLVLFDPELFSDTATYDRPRAYPKGLKAVIVGGVPVIENGSRTGARPGCFVRAGQDRL